MAQLHKLDFQSVSSQIQREPGAECRARLCAGTRESGRVARPRPRGKKRAKPGLSAPGSSIKALAESSKPATALVFCCWMAGATRSASARLTRSTGLNPYFPPWIKQPMLLSWMPHLLLQHDAARRRAVHESIQKTSRRNLFRITMRV